ncbi:hypothetical protein NDU88_008410 [Pleurodeles waltl]|uniref:Uncharacterized protein n=1 Tax=Pleurodeles waltl TaxID=8319 RepID=A0AAV7N4Y3_PLEWA|nr:hypothetical protein NDU88_008410 [Pleurodeles waltl]
MCPLQNRQSRAAGAVRRECRQETDTARLEGQSYLRTVRTGVITASGSGEQTALWESREPAHRGPILAEVRLLPCGSDGWQHEGKGPCSAQWL